jgi:GntR family transcriptional regulator / MocR family aminotransferase
MSVSNSMNPSGPILALAPRASGVTITRWLYDELRRAILDGRLRRGAAIPPSRGLAIEYGMSRRIVVNVFDQLRDEGYLEARTGAGTRVSARVPEDFLAKSRFTQATPRQDAVEGMYRRPARPFRPIEPALAEFPMEIWARLAGRCMRRASLSDLAGGDQAGYRPLREEIAAYLGGSRGVSCSASQIVITSGTQQALDLLSRAILKPGDPVWMEDPGYTDAIEMFEQAGAEIVPVPVDARGIDVDRGRAKCPLPAAVYVTPAHQFPLGVTMELDRRLQLLQWSRRKKVPVIEDDYDSEFRFSGRPVPALKGLAGAEHVFLLGTFNKALFPALRLGYMVVPDAWIDSVLRLRRRVERYAPGLSQMVLASFLAEGQFARHLRRMRELYGARLASLRQDVDRYLKGVLSLPEIEAGLNTPAWLHNGMTSKQAARLAEMAHLETWPLDRFAIARTDLRGLVLGFAAFDKREIRAGVIALAKALAAGPTHGDGSKQR